MDYKCEATPLLNFKGRLHSSRLPPFPWRHQHYGWKIHCSLQQRQATQCHRLISPVVKLTGKDCGNIERAGRKTRTSKEAKKERSDFGPLVVAQSFQGG